MGAAIGALFGLGCFCLWWSCWVPEPGTTARSAPSAAVGRVRRALRDLLARSGVEALTPSGLLGTCLAASAVTWVVVAGVSQVPMIATCFAGFAGWAPIAALQGRARRRQALLRELWPEAVDNLCSAVRAGMALPEALSQLGERGPAPLRPAFRAFGQDYRATGRFGECLETLADRLADPVADRLCEALRITRDVGGSDLGRLLRTLSGFLREEARTRAELEARQSWTVNAARLAVAAPWAILAVLAVQPQAVRAYDTPAGAVVLVAGAVVCLVAYRLMVRLARLPEPQRVLR